MEHYIQTAKINSRFRRCYRERQRHTQQPDDKINHRNYENRNPENNSPIITSTDSSHITVSSNQVITSTQKRDSSAITTAGNAAKQQTKAIAVKVKKSHGEKATSFELMVAGYGNSRNVYDVSRLNAVRLFAFGPINQKEKVLMQSYSINTRIDKPITKTSLPQNRAAIFTDAPTPKLWL